MKTLLLVVILLLVNLFIIANFNYDVEIKNINTEKKVKVVVDNVEKQVLFKDIQKYNLSQFMIDSLTNSIKKYSIKYNLPVSLIHSIIKIESDYRYKIAHSSVTIVVIDSMLTTSAIGLGGIIWEFWADSLKKNNIAINKQELFNPDVNIEATAFILRTIINSLKEKNYVNADNLISYLVKRYYGTTNKYYENKLKAYMSNFAYNNIKINLYNK